MLDFNHIFTVILTEWKTYSAGLLFSAGLYIWVAHKLSDLAKSDGGKVFWLVLSVVLFNNILRSNSILFNEMTYVAIAIFVTHFDIVLKPFIALKNSLQQRAYNKYQNCVNRNDFIENLEAKEQREEKQVLLEERKQKQQEKYLDKLSKKLDSF